MQLFIICRQKSLYSHKEIYGRRINGLHVVNKKCIYANVVICFDILPICENKFFFLLIFRRNEHLAGYKESCTK